MRAILVFMAIAVLVSCKKESTQTHLPKAATDTVMEFTMWGTTYRFSSDSAIAKETVVNGQKQIEIDANKLVGQDGTVYNFWIRITGNPEVNPGVYTYNKSASFFRRDGDEIIIERDFSLQVLSYQDGYLSGTFFSSQVINGAINKLKVAK